MKTEQITEGNKLIAEFMGIRDCPNRYDKPGWEYWYLGNWWTARTLRYHHQWNWLMPVVSKAGGIFFCDMEGYGGFDIEYMMGESELGWHLKMGNIGEVWSIMVKWVEWYNKNK